MYLVDRNAYGGGLMIFIRTDICFHVVTRFNIDMSSFRTESMLLKVKRRNLGCLKGQFQRVKKGATPE